MKALKDSDSHNFSNADSAEIAAFYDKIASRVQHFRRLRGISQLELALEIGIKSVAFYSNCESNRYGKHFNLEHIYKLAKALKVPLSEFFEDFTEFGKSEFEDY